MSWPMSEIYRTSHISETLSIEGPTGMTIRPPLRATLINLTKLLLRVQVQNQHQYQRVNHQTHRHSKQKKCVWRLESIGPVLRVHMICSKGTRTWASSGYVQDTSERGGASRASA